MGRFFPRELNQSKVREVLNLKQDSMSVHEYGLKFTKLSHYGPDMPKDIKSRMNLFVAGFLTMLQVKRVGLKCLFVALTYQG